MAGSTGAEAAGGVVLAGLLDGVEAAPAAGVGAAPGDVEPVALVAVHVVVDELGLEPRGAGPPVAAEVVDEVAGDELAQAVRHEAGGGELAHGGVHQRLAGLAAAPAGRRRGRARRGLLAEPGGAVQAPAVLEVQEAEVVAPQQLEPQPVAAVAGALLRLEGLEVGVGGARRQAPLASQGENLLEKPTPVRPLRVAL
jgi:hypothetical protein